jgi:adenylylsulfate kinase
MHKGFTLWFTGMSGAGKSTISERVYARLKEAGAKVELLDGDVVRTHLSKGLGFSKEDRDLNIERIGWVASRLTRHGAAVIASAISPYADVRARARQMVEEFGPFVEVFVDVSVEEATRRDIKGLYEKALKGEIQNFTGVSDPYEKPESPEIRIDSDTQSPEESAQRILVFLEGKGLIPAAVTA